MPTVSLMKIKKEKEYMLEQIKHNKIVSVYIIMQN